MGLRARQGTAYRTVVRQEDKKLIATRELIPKRRTPAGGTNTARLEKGVTWGPEKKKKNQKPRFKNKAAQKKWRKAKVAEQAERRKTEQARRDAWRRRNGVPLDVPIGQPYKHEEGDMVERQLAEDALPPHDWKPVVSIPFTLEVEEE